MPQTIKSAVVLACGNTLRGDDGVAWQIGAEVQRSLRHFGVEVIFTQQFLPEHAEPLSWANLAIFIDCSSVAEPGAVSTIRVRQANCLPSIFTHHLDPASLLRLTQDLYGCTPSRAVAITIGGQSFELSETLSKPVAEAIPIAKAAVCAMFPSP
jgi:hydrogenase maturation protease